MSHKCHAEACEVEVDPSKLMCLKHWRMVPRMIQSKVWATYVKGQEVRKDPSRAYLAVAQQAIDAVAKLEGRRA